MFFFILLSWSFTYPSLNGSFPPKFINFKQASAPQLGKTVQNSVLTSLNLLKISGDNTEPELKKKKERIQRDD